MKPITINHEQSLYVISHGKFYTCLGFEVAYKQAVAIAKYAGLELPKEKPGTYEAYDEYSRIMAVGAEYAKTHAKCDFELTPQLVGLEGKRVEVETVYGETRRFWVGKSTGWMPCHLEVAKSNSSGGPAAEKEYKFVRIIH